MREQVLVWGSGAIGGTLGAYLCRAGHDVTFVDTVAEHVQAIANRQLHIEGPIDTFTTGGPAFTPQNLQGHYSLILLAVKAQHTEVATRDLLPFLSNDGVVVSCQNGLNEPVIASIVGARRTIGCFVNFGADYLGPGRIVYGIRGAVVVGELNGESTARIHHVHKLLEIFEPEAKLSANIFGYLWGKAAYGAILKYSALSNDSISDFISASRRRPAIVALAREVLSVAHAEGVRPQGFDGFDPNAFLRHDMDDIHASLDRLADHNRNSGKPHTGVWRDLVVRKRPTEVRAQYAPILAAARRHGLPTPCYDALVAAIEDVEAGQLCVGPALADTLLAHVSPK